MAFLSMAFLLYYAQLCYRANHFYAPCISYVMTQTLKKAKYHYHLAKVAHQNRDFYRAIENYHEVLRFLPEEASILCNLAHCYFEIHNYASASHAYKTYLDHGMDTEALLNLAICYERQSFYDQAETAYKQLLKLDPYHFEAYFNLGICQLKQTKQTQAYYYFNQALKLKPQDARVQFHLNVLGQNNVDRAPEQYITNLFDQYANHFDHHLASLDYQVPTALFILIKNKLNPRPKILDLGCGTGLMAEQFQAMRPLLTGVDLSPKMLTQAKAKGLYQALYCEEITRFLERDAITHFDFVLAADVLVYVGDLKALFTLLPKHLKASGYFAFSVETLSTENKHPYLITAAGRFQHKIVYIKQLAKEHGFEIIEQKSIEGRKQAGQFVSTALFCLQC